MNMDKRIERILEAGNTAPSGENCQPWRFVVDGMRVDLFMLPERDQSVYNWGQRSSYIACGAVLENMALAATAEGLRADIAHFPNAQDQNHIATVMFNADETVTPDPLAGSISKRVTNRKSYSREPLGADAEHTFKEAANEPGITFTLVEDRDAIEKLARVGSTNEEIMLANRTLHDFFFDHVNWTLAEEKEKKVGFFIKTLELPPPAVAMFRLFRSWPIMRVFKALGFPRIVAKQNASTNAATSAIGAFFLEGIQPLDFVNAGRAIERVWLTATMHGLSVQPLTGVLFFKLKIAGEEGGVFSPTERAKVLAAYQTAADILGAGDRHVVFMCRIGKGDRPTAQAVRLSLKETVMIRP